MIQCVTEGAELSTYAGSGKQMTKKLVPLLAILILWMVIPVSSSNVSATASPEDQPSASSQNQPAAYVLGPSDSITIQALDVDEISNKPIWIDTGGFINLPLVGRVKAAGLTVQELEAEINVQLKPFVKVPHVVVAVTEFRSQPVSVLGFVNTPGVLQVQGRKTLLEVFSQAGGLKPDAAAVAKITRRLDYGEIPLPGATRDPSGQFSVADLQLKALIEGRSPEQNIQVRPHDVISVPKADILYVVGEVKKPGGFVLADRRRTTVIEALALAEGLEEGTPAASALNQWRRLIEQGRGQPGQWTLESAAIPPLFFWLLKSGGEDLASGFEKAADVYRARAAYRTEVALYGALPVSILLLGQMALWQVWPMMQTMISIMHNLGDMGGG